MMDVIIPVGDMPVTAQVTTPGKAIVAAQVSAAGYEQAIQAADRADAAASNANASAAKADAAAQSVAGRTRNDITPLVRDGTLSEAVRADDLAARGLKVGDYFTGKSGYTYHLADMDTFYGGYNSYAVVAQHHAGIVVDTHTHDKWNDAADTSNGYVSSKLHSLLVNTHLPVIRSDIADLTGGDAADHLIAHSKLYSTKVQNGVSSSWVWSSGQYISALTEMQVYGGTVLSSSGFDTGEAFRQLGVFAKFDPNLLFGKDAVWLRDVHSATHAAVLNGHGGYADFSATTYQLRVAGLILFH